ncbi:MAG: hypothetical protein JW720_12805 [Sedimentisphaerales bacterium]|nr:hypothetical protein [Sedimentisphaerales bacterium]
MRGAFSLVEVVVVVSVVAVVISILLPAIGRARRQALALKSMNNQRQIVTAVNLFAADGDDRYPDSVATIGTEAAHWNWHEPMKLIGHRARSPRMFRTVSAYLYSYLPDPRSVYCPCAPRRYKYFDQAWAAAEDWDNPDTPMRDDPLTGTYCLYWNYTGYLDDTGDLFQGPRGPAHGRFSSGLVVSCFLGYDQYLSRGKYGSCRRFPNADKTQGTYEWPAYWSVADSQIPRITLYAGYTDTHVESCSADETVAVSVIKDPEKAEPYPAYIGPGKFFIPRQALQ